MTFSLSDENKNSLLALAQTSIEHGIKTGARLSIDHAHYPKELQAHLSTFVTLHLNGKLRGCIGGLQAQMPLVEDVAEHAYAAAFRDPRFPSLTEHESKNIDIEISVLSPQQAIACNNDDELLNKLQPHIDGLVIQDGIHHSTFLPSVWEHFTQPQEFLQQLKLKAGLPANHWSPTFQAFRYTTLSFHK